jgi:hypothetical protein
MQPCPPPACTHAGTSPGSCSESRSRNCGCARVPVQSCILFQMQSLCTSVPQVPGCTHAPCVGVFQLVALTHDTSGGNYCSTHDTCSCVRKQVCPYTHYQVQKDHHAGDDQDDEDEKNLHSLHSSECSWTCKACARDSMDEMGRAHACVHKTCENDNDELRHRLTDNA